MKLDGGNIVFRRHFLNLTKVHLEISLKKEEEESWKQFRDTGLFHFANEFLHMFGWCICLSIDDKGKITAAFPQRCSYTGFSEESNEKSYKKVWSLLKDNPDIEKK